MGPFFVTSEERFSWKLGVAVLDFLTTQSARVGNGKFSIILDCIARCSRLALPLGVVVVCCRCCLSCLVLFQTQDYTDYLAAGPGKDGRRDAAMGESVFYWSVKRIPGVSCMWCRGVQ